MKLSVKKEYQVAVDKVAAENNNEYTDFHARRMVEMAGNIMMTYLLLIDTQRDARFKNNTTIFLKMAISKNKERAEYINKSELSDLDIFRQ